MNIGDIVSCRITDLGGYGAYGITENGTEVFVNFGELSWDRIRETTEIVNIDQIVEVFVMRLPLPNHPCVLASIKRMNPKPDPWPRNAGVEVGKKHEATVSQIGSDVIFAVLPFDVVACIPLENPSRFKIDEKICVRIFEVNKKKWKGFRLGFGRMRV